MALTKIGTDGVKDDAVTSGKIPANAVGTSEIANDAVTSTQIADNTIVDGDIADATITLNKLVHGTSSNDGKFLRANNGADPTFETVSIPDADKIIEGNTKAEVVDTGAGYFKVETDGSERFRVDDNGKLTTGGETSPDVIGGGLCLNTGAQDGIFLSCKNSDIAHGRTSLDETDTLFSMRKISGDKGGVDIRGYTDAAGGDPAIRIFGTIDDSSDAGYCPVELRGARKNTGGNTGTSGIPVDRGVVRISNDGDNTVATFTGEGLCFHSDTAAANALDDYEEGTWSPTLFTQNGASNATINAAGGFYTKVGRLVHVTFHMDWNGATNHSGYVYFNNLPFTSQASSSGYYQNGVGAVMIHGMPFAGTAPVLLMGGSSTGTNLYFSSNNSGWIPGNNSNTGQIIASLTYNAA